MAWIDVIDLRAATGKLREYYEKYFIKPGIEDNVVQVHSLNPKSLDLHYRLYAHLMRGPSELSREQREMIAVVVSRINHCRY